MQVHGLLGEFFRNVESVCVCQCLLLEYLLLLQDAAGHRSLVFALSITHDRIGHAQQNGLLSHPQDLDTPLPLAVLRKVNSYRQQYP